MKIQFCAIGKSDEAYVKEGVKDFTQRISRYYPVEWKIIAPPKKGAAVQEAEWKTKEGVLIMEHVKKDDFLIALDERGKMLDSSKLASFIEVRLNESVKQMIFLIGGAYGIDETVLKRSNFIWSLSSLTFPHQLVRLILAEQVYRACTIIRNEKYHHA
ncbi:MAG: 23S rRNA (pseudouridine(1915)-N(3))-methyltransferase RlmH [Agriterribacter sp.]